MAKRKQSGPKKKETSRTVQTASNFKKITGCADEDLSKNLLNQLIQTLWIPEGTSKEKQDRVIQATFATLKGIAPKNEIEGLLAAQMVSTHSAAMECLRRAMLENQTFEGRDQSLKHATKLLSIYMRQIETLDKHRGKGQQKITVEHVNVHAGGQAIVGNVKTGDKSKPSRNSTPPALENNPDPIIPTNNLIDIPEQKQKVRSRDGE